MVENRQDPLVELGVRALFGLLPMDKLIGLFGSFITLDNILLFLSIQAAIGNLITFILTTVGAVLNLPSSIVTSVLSTIGWLTVQDAVGNIVSFPLTVVGL